MRTEYRQQVEGRGGFIFKLGDQLDAVLYGLQQMGGFDESGAKGEPASTPFHNLSFQ